MANPFCHIELNTDDVGKAKKFYKSLFGWKLSDMKGMSYTMIDVGKGGVGGGMQKKPMPDAPSSWVAYVEVDDVKKTIAKAKKAGAQILLDYMAIGDSGEIGIFADPSGAPLGVWAPQKKPKKAAAKKASAKKAAKPEKKAAKKKKS